jgi:hypothetical protein
MSEPRENPMILGLKPFVLIELAYEDVDGEEKLIASMQFGGGIERQDVREVLELILGTLPEGPVENIGDGMRDEWKGENDGEAD